MVQITSPQTAADRIATDLMANGFLVETTDHPGDPEGTIIGAVREDLRLSITVGRTP